MELFYANPQNISGTEITLDDFETKHLFQTLKKQEGTLLHVTDGRGTHFRARLIEKKPKPRLAIEEQELIPETHLKIALGLGFIRPNRLEFVLEKGTELGISEFHLIRSRFSNYSSNNSKRYEKILRQAIKQSVQFYLPRIFFHDSVDTFLQETKSFGIRYAAISADSPSFYKMMAARQLSPDTSILVAVGPEGGFSEEEIDLFDNNNCTSISLGQTRLRAETAAVCAVSALQNYILYTMEESNSD